MPTASLPGAVLCLVLLVASALPEGSPAGDAGRVAALVTQLGDDSFAKREEAARALAALGSKALPRW